MSIQLTVLDSGTDLDSKISVYDGISVGYARKNGYTLLIIGDHSIKVKESLEEINQLWSKSRGKFQNVPVRG